MDLMSSFNGHCLEGTTELDRVPNNFRLTFIDFATLFLSIVFYFVDLILDGEAAYEYYSRKEYSNFALTIGINLLSGIVVTLISIRMYVDDREVLNSRRKYLCRITFSGLGVVLQLSQLIRICDSFKYAVKSYKAQSKGDVKNQKTFFYKYLKENADAAWLKVFECYLESAPTVVLQLSFMLITYQHSLNFIRWMLLILNFLFLGYSMATYHRNVRFDQEDKNNISLSGCTFLFLWHTNFVVCRILTLAVLFSIHPLWACVAVICHWFVMTIWIVATTKTNFCGTSFISELFFAGTIGLVYIFNFVNLKDRPTRKYYLTFFLICFFETLTVCSLWAVYSSYSSSHWVYHLFLEMPILTFLLAIVFSIIYYKWYHPNIIEQKRANLIFNRES